MAVRPNRRVQLALSWATALQRQRAVIGVGRVKTPTLAIVCAHILL
jgi:DNA topoisomerase IA